jgi:hypothetical protein
MGRGGVVANRRFSYLELEKNRAKRIVSNSNSKK